MSRSSALGTVGAEVARGFLRSPDRRIGPAGGRVLELAAIADLNVQGAVDRGMPRELIVPDAPEPWSGATTWTSSWS